MQQLIGRLTQNAKVGQLKDGRKVTNFSIALNDSYKQKGSCEVKKIVTYVDCAYWINEKVAAYLIKGSLVESNGRIGVRAYLNLQNEARGVLTCLVQEIKILSYAKATTHISTVSPTQGVSTEPADDLPF